mmetsp:Transcript_36831/g.86022  ORF Transcript_36831/g.86022 Transcript_36831/m.86022 type:complete len:207 (-) Transcript_36831:366-986(-)
MASMSALVLLAGQTAAFAPELSAVVSRAAPRSSLSMQAKSKAIPFLDQPPALDGTMAGDIGFDPLLLSNIIPIKWAREAELKHARVCMLATLGWVAVDLGFTMPEAPKVSSLAAHDVTVDKGPMFFLLLVISTIEIVGGIPKVFQLLNDEDAAAPGDYKFDPIGFGGSMDLQEKELANGRLAMMAFSGIVTQASLTGNGFPYLYGN